MVSIAWEAVGPPTAPPIVFCHSLGLDRSMWQLQVDALANNYRLIMVDTRGHGASEVPPGPYTIEELALDVLGAAEAAGADRFHMCGISLGGMMALWVAAHRPERLLSVIACNTAAVIRTPEFWQARSQAVRAGGMESILDGVVGGWFTPGFAAEQPDTLRLATRLLSATDPDGYSNCCLALGSADLTGEIGSIDLPTLIIAGDLDGATPPSQARWLHHQIPGSELAVLEGASHISNLNQPEAFNQALVRFLEKQ